MIYNEKSGFHNTQKHYLYTHIMPYFTACGYEVRHFNLQEQSDFSTTMQHILAWHRSKNDQGMVVVVGGDGTLNTVARYMLNSNIPIGLLPTGTFNYVARLWNIPLDLMQAAEVAVHGALRSLHVACLNEYIYLNNASLGLYPLFIERREYFNQRFGRLAIHAYTSALEVLLRRRKELRLSITVNDKLYAVKTPLVFLGNNQLQLAELKLDIADAAQNGLVAGVVVAKSDKKTLFKLLYQLVKGNIESAEDVYSFSAQYLRIDAKHAKLSIALDGELKHVKPPLNIRIARSALQLMVPYDSTYF